LRKNPSFDKALSAVGVRFPCPVEDFGGDGEIGTEPVKNSRFYPGCTQFTMRI
jgi:hypothetical protein